MTIYNKMTAKTVAKELIQAGLESGAIKLYGVPISGQAQSASDADALYLSNLLIKLSEKISNNDG